MCTDANTFIDPDATDSCVGKELFTFSTSVHNNNFQIMERGTTYAETG